MKKIVIVGIGGYGTEHLRSIDILEKEGELKLVGAVIRREHHEETRQRLEKKGVAVFKTLGALLKSGLNFDIVSIPTGIMWHESMITESLDAGYHVICEKPLTGTVKEAMSICEAVKRTKRICAIGYQNMYSKSIEKIKKITIEKQLGNLISVRTLVKWPRAQSYYTRNEWAGEIEFNGKKIYDSIAQNACAHFLQNMLFVSGEGEKDSANIRSVYGENYKAKDINSADTQFIKVRTVLGVEIIFIGTHCVMKEYGPLTEYVYEKGKITWKMGGETRVYDINGAEIEGFDNDGEDFKTNIFRNALKSIYNNTEPKCVPSNAMQHTVVIENAFKSSNGVNEIPQEHKETHFLEKSFYSQVKLDGPDPNVVIVGIEEACEQAMKTGRSFSELQVPWAVAGKEIAL